MRVTTGSAKGRNLKGPPNSGTRPMSDKIRQAVFSALASLGVEPDRVLDLYAGTGAIGIEALSRGAGHADFVEMTAPAAAVIRENLERTQLSDFGLRSSTICAKLSPSQDRPLRPRHTGPALRRRGHTGYASSTERKCAGTIRNGRCSRTLAAARASRSDRYVAASQTPMSRR